MDVWALEVYILHASKSFVKMHIHMSSSVNVFRLAVLSSPRLWIDVFALPEKSNMAVTESDPDPKVWKMSITF